MHRRSQSTEAEIDKQFPGAVRSGAGGRGVTASRYSVSFWGDESVLKLIMAAAAQLQIYQCCTNVSPLNCTWCG